MKEKMRAIFDSRVTWASFGTVAGALLGDKAALVVNALGALVMAVL